VRSLRSQLKSLSSKNPNAEIKAASDAIGAKLAALEGEEGGYGTSFLSNPEGRSLARLNAGFSAILSALDTADGAPTTQQSAMFGELEKVLEEQLAAWRQLQAKDLPDFNETLKKAGRPAVHPQAVAEGSGAQISSQNRDRDLE
jgi:hypothetical protein